MPAKLGRGIWIFTLLVIAVLSWQWVDDRDVEPEPTQNTIDMAANQSDYYLEDFEIINIGKRQSSGDTTGTGRYLKLTGKSLSHHFIEGYSGIENPSVQLRSNENELWQANAQRGRVSANFDVLDLQGNVELTHNRQQGKPPISVDTESLTIDTTQQLISTDEPVEVVGSGWHYNANNLRAEIDKGVLSLTQGVEAQFDNPKKQ